MAASMTFTYDETGSPVRGAICKMIVEWVSDGAADPAPGESAGTSKKISGRLIKGVTVPGAGGLAPTDDYDIVITDADGVDVLGNCSDDLIDRDTANTEEMYFLANDGATTVAQHPAVCSALTVTVTAAGNDNAGTLYLYYVRA